MSTKDLKKTLVGTAIFIGLCIPLAFFALLGWWIWGDSGVFLGLLPIGVAFVLIAGSNAGEDL